MFFGLATYMDVCNDISIRPTGESRNVYVTKLLAIYCHRQANYDKLMMYIVILRKIKKKMNVVWTLIEGKTR